MKNVKFDYLIAAVRVLAGPMAFLFTILFGAVIGLFRPMEPMNLFLAAVCFYIFFYMAGNWFSKFMTRVHYEVTDIDRGKVVKKKAGKQHLGRLLDIHQTAEHPFDR